jgi:hypothetical protein
MESLRSTAPRPFPPAPGADPQTQLNSTWLLVSCFQAQAEDYEEAGNEIMLLDDDEVPFVSGECFIHLPREAAEEQLQKREPTIIFSFLPSCSFPFLFVGLSSFAPTTKNAL